MDGFGGIFPSLGGEVGRVVEGEGVGFEVDGHNFEGLLHVRMLFKLL